MSITTTLEKALRAWDKTRMALSSQPKLPAVAPNEALATALREKLCALDIDLSPDLPRAEHTWNRNMRRLQLLAETDDPRRFLNWDVVAGTMFVKYAKYSRTEYRHLRSLPDWPRWQEALREDLAGLPAKCPFDQTTSCNLVHHAYHVSRFEECIGTRASAFDHVFEFGGGYGSMCRLFFKLGFKGTYLILDLPAFSALQEYFLKSVGIRVLTKEQFLRGESGAFCTPDVNIIEELPASKKRLFLATWSISESPLSVREKILDRHGNLFDAYLVAYQPHFEDVDNNAYFDRLRSSLPGYSWKVEEMAHLRNQKYLFGGKNH